MPLCLTSIDFPAHPRRQLRACLEEQRIASGSQMPAAAVNEAVDLACHAAESARRTMFEILDRASDPRITTTSIGLAISLLSSDCARIEAGLRDYAEQTGATFREARVEIS